MANRVDFVSAVDAAGLARDVTDLFGDSNVTRTMTWHYVDRTDPDLYGSFGGTIVDTGSTSESIEMIRGHVRDSVSNDIVVGRYRFLARVPDFVAGTPDTNDNMVDGPTSDVLQVNAVRSDPLGLVYVIEATVVES